MKKIFIFLIYFLLSAIITYPLILNLNKILLGWPLDAYNYLWNIDTFWKQIFALQNPFYTNRIFFPTGTSLIFHTYAPLISLIGLPFYKAQVIYQNLLVILSMPLSAYFAFLLTFKITKIKNVSFIAGLIYGFSPVMVSYLVSQHYYFAYASALIPVSILLLYEYLLTWKSKYIAFIFIAFWAAFFIDYYTTVMIVFSDFLFFVLFLSLEKKWSSFVKKFLKINWLYIITFFILPSFIIFGLASLTFSMDGFSFTKSSYPLICSASPKGLFTPSQFNPLLKFASVDKTFSDTPSVFIGWILPLISLLTLFLFKKNKTVLVLFTIEIFFILFSLGPLAFLFNIISGIPSLGLIDCPQRFIIGAELPVAVLTGIFLSSFAKKRYFKSLIILTTLIFFIEYFSFNLPFSHIEVPSIYKFLGTQNNNQTVLELPSGIAESKGAFGYDWSMQALLLKEMYWQEYSGKPRVGGYTSRLAPYIYQYYKNESIISDLFKMTSLGGVWTGKSFSENQVEIFIKKFNLGYIIISPNSRQNEFSKVVETIFKPFIEKKITSEGWILYLLKQ